MEYIKIKYKYLAKLIKNGMYKDGKPFLPVDFFKYVSGYRHGEDFVAFIHQELSCLFKQTDEEYQIIYSFVVKHKYNWIYFLEREWVYENPMYTYNVKVTKEMIDTVFAYMEFNGYPSINYVYNYFFQKYATNRMKLDKESSQSKKNNSDNIIRLPLMKK